MGIHDYESQFSPFLVVREDISISVALPGIGYSIFHLIISSALPTTS